MFLNNAEKCMDETLREEDGQAPTEPVNQSGGPPTALTDAGLDWVGSWTNDNKNNIKTTTAADRERTSSVVYTSANPRVG